MKRVIWRVFKGLFIFSVVIVGIIFYAYKIEPKRLVTREFDMELSSESQESIRVVQFSDTHLGPDYSLQQLEKLVDRINELEPDIIAFTGDLIDIPSQFEEKSEISSILGKLRSTYGNYAVWGNHDYGGGGVRFYEDIMINSGFTLLRNQHNVIELDSGQLITMIGLDDAMLGYPDIEKSFIGVGDQGVNLLLLHEPDLVDEIETNRFDLALAGHSHGGQVVIPLFGPLVTPPFAKIYTKGMYDLATDTYLYVNSGIGTTKIAVRFWNPPELSVFDLAL